MKWSQQLLTRMSDFLTYALLPACTDSSDSGYCIAGGDGRSLIVTNLKDGVDIYSLPPGQPLRAFKHNIARNVPLTVSSALGGSIIVVGSDDGHARVYDPHLGIMVCVLQHGNGMRLLRLLTAHQGSLIHYPAGSLVQAVDVCSPFRSPSSSNLFTRHTRRRNFVLL